MIFVNRHRIIQNSGVIKDPTKYWYVEKYVYGVLKETLEIPLKTSTKFTSIDSGYDDDTFYGWSIDGSSTRVTFNSKSTYKNTTSSVKKYLDSENTIKLYAIYSYNVKSSIFDEKNMSVTDGKSTISGTWYVNKDCDVSFYGYNKHTYSGIGGSGTAYNPISVNITTYNNITNTESTTTLTLTYSSGTTTKTLAANTKINFSIRSYDHNSSTGGGRYSEYLNINVVRPSGNHDVNLGFYMLSTSYRVLSHT